MSRSSICALASGWMSNGRSRARRLSDRRRSSAGVARARLGPTRIQTRPRSRTGGASAGSTRTTATSHAPIVFFEIVRLGSGMMLPSLRIAARDWSSCSEIGRFEHEPSSFTPTKRTPGRWWLGRSFAKAQRACRIFSGSEIEAFRSTRSDSGSRKRASSSSFVIPPAVPVRSPIYDRNGTSAAAVLPEAGRRVAIDRVRRDSPRSVQCRRFSSGSAPACTAPRPARRCSRPASR